MDQLTIVWMKANLEKLSELYGSKTTSILCNDAITKKIDYKNSGHDFLGKVEVNVKWKEMHFVEHVDFSGLSASLNIRCKLPSLENFKSENFLSFKMNKPVGPLLAKFDRLQFIGSDSIENFTFPIENYLNSLKETKQLQMPILFRPESLKKSSSTMPAIQIGDKTMFLTLNGTISPALSRNTSRTEIVTLENEVSRLNISKDDLNSSQISRISNNVFSFGGFFFILEITYPIYYSCS